MRNGGIVAAACSWRRGMSAWRSSHQRRRRRIGGASAALISAINGSNKSGVSLSASASRGSIGGINGIAAAGATSWRRRRRIIGVSAAWRKSAAHGMAKALGAAQSIALGGSGWRIIGGISGWRLAKRSKAHRRIGSRSSLLAHRSPRLIGAALT